MLLVINCNSRYFKNICFCLRKLKVRYKVIKNYDVTKVNLKKYSGVIISGNPLMLSKLDENTRRMYLNPFNFIKNCKIPVLGICHGHQVLGLLFGSKIKQGKTIERNNYITLLDRSSLFNGLNKVTKFREAHAEYINLPPSFKLMATSKSCKVEAMRHQNKKIFGVQFHPEISGRAGLRVLKNFMKYI